MERAEDLIQAFNWTPLPANFNSDLEGLEELTEEEIDAEFDKLAEQLPTGEGEGINADVPLEQVFDITDLDNIRAGSTPLSLSKKRSQEKSYEVRGQSDVCHTSVNFMPAFPWHQMGGKFSRKLVSTLSYLLYTCLCQETSKWFIFFLKFPICSPRMLCEQLQAICLIPLKLQHHVIMLNFEFPQCGNSLFFPPTTSISQ